MTTDTDFCAVRGHDNKPATHWAGDEHVCRSCWNRWKRTGSTAQRPPSRPLSDKVIADLTELDEIKGCLTWTGATDKDGYPRYYDSSLYASGSTNNLIYVRRWVLEKNGIELGRRFIADDECSNRLCVNREHLVKSTYGRRTQAGKNSVKKFCDSGHEFTPENTRIRDNGNRSCKQCAWEAAKRSLGLDPATIERGIANKDKVYCLRGHLLAGDNLYRDPKNNDRHCLLCRRINHLMRVYGITWEEYEQMMEDQKGLCVVCSCDLNNLGRNPDVEHCHVTGKFRGISCSPCNRTMGIVGDDPKRLRALADYLEKHLPGGLL